jgi:molybdate transport system substrate-binding protein
MKILLSFFLLLSLFLWDAKAAEIRVSAAISLSDALNEIGSSYERTTGNRMVFNFGASSLLARQIEEGAPADIFFSADEEKMNELQSKQLVDIHSRVNLLSNVLVVVVPLDSKETIASVEGLLKTKGNVAIAEPDAVPGGIYAKQYLLKKGLWDELESRVVPTENVRAALAVVESGDAAAGFVYRTDARISKKVRIAFEINDADKPQIAYPVAALSNTGDPTLTKEALSYLCSPEARKIYQKYGFVIPSK